MKVLLIDFDKTLGDITPYLSNLKNDIKTMCHVSNEQIEKAFEKVSDKYGVNDWQPFYQYVADSSGCSPEVVKEALYKSIPSIILNPEALQFLQDFEGEKILFSYGEEDFQSAKINVTKANRYVDDILITVKPKIESLSELITNNQLQWKNQFYTDVTLLDDNKMFLDEVRSSFPFIQVVDIEELK